MRLVRRAVLWSTFATTCYGSARGQVSSSELLSDGWIIHQTPADRSDSLRCANYSRSRWRVTQSDVGNVLITPAPAPLSTLKVSETELPPRVKLQPGMVGGLVTLRLEDGWLLGFDGGEFGGGLWFATFDGKTQRLSEENVHGLVKTSQSVFIFVGNAQLIANSGKILTVPFTVESASDLKKLADLDGVPEAFTKLSDETVVVVTTHGVFRINSSGATDKLLSRNFGLLYPNSIASTKDGTVYVGMRLFVVRLVLRSGEYKEEWLTQKACAKFRTSDFQCMCSE
jgi:hypothetical protein